MPSSDIDKRKNRDEDMKGGSPPRPASHPHGSDDSTRNAKTLTDPATGEPQRGPPRPSRSSN